jgi:uncharacterized Zn finger protein
MDSDDELLGRIRGQLSDDDFTDLKALLGQRRSQSSRSGSVPAGGSGSARPGAKRRTFGHTWWGRAWIDAIETKARMDPNRLPRGRTYARQNRVLNIEAAPGEVKAFVQGKQPRPYHVVVAVRQFTDPEWDAVLDAIAGKAAHAAALLDGELLPEILDEAELLPGPGDLVPSCSCPDWADPCKHAAAVCYLIADLLDDDPFTLLALRGRDRNQVLSEIRARRRAESTDRSDAPATTVSTPEHEPTVAAATAYAGAAEIDPAERRRRLTALGHQLQPRRPAAPPPLAVDPPVASGIRSTDLANLGADASDRAFGVLAFGDPTGLELDLDHDLARRAAQWFDEDDDESHNDPDHQLDELSSRSGVPLHLVRRDARAWQLGGPEAIDVLYERWDATPEQLDEGRGAIAMATRSQSGNRVRADGNRLVAGPFQLRLAPSGRWYRLEKAAGLWELRRRGEADPTELFRR